VTGRRDRQHGQFNVCPDVTSFTATPLTARVGNTIALTATARDRDNDPIGFAWSAPSGTFSSPNAANTNFLCTSAGTFSLTLSVNDGPARGCTRSRFLSVNCAPADLDGGATPPDAGPGPSPDASPAGGDAGVANIQILAFNDFHGNIEPPTGSNGNVVPGRGADGGVLPAVTAGGAGYFAQHIATLRAQNPNTIVVSAGDLINASPLASALFHDEPTIEAMNLIGLDFNGVGNHEFDDGRAELLRMQNGGCAPEGCRDGGVPQFAGASFKFLAANVKTETGETIFPRYAVKTVDGVKVAFIGMTLEGTPGIVTPSGVAGLTFFDEADTVNALVPELQAQGIKAIVVIIHEGGFQSGLINECNGISGEIVGIVNRLDNEVDLVVSGHTHAAYNCVIANKRVTSALSFGRLVTQIQLNVNRNTQQVESVSAENKVVTRTVTPAPAVDALVNDYVARVAPLRDRVIGNASAALSRTNNASGESALGDIIADAQLASTFDATRTESQIAFMNPGGVRADIDLGSITYGEAFTVQPFGNGTVALTLTGAQVKAALEQQFVGFMGQTTQRILSPSANVSYTWSASAPAGSKISNATIGGLPIVDTANYRVTVNSFLATGGDGFLVFNAGTNRVGGDVDIDALEKYLTLPANNPISPPALTRVTRVP
jgi:5'-nucleotidase